jgi:hypothetical protein
MSKSKTFDIRPNTRRVSLLYDPRARPQILLTKHTQRKMTRIVPREGVACACLWNWIALALLLYACISSYWSYGAWIVQNTVTFNGFRGQISVGPWVAGQGWGQSFVGGIVRRTSNLGVVYWNSVPVDQACNVFSSAYQLWAGPLNLCSFPSSATRVPTAAPTSVNVSIPTGAPTNYDGELPPVPPLPDVKGFIAGTQFVTPSDILGVQATIILGCLTCFFAAVVGTADAAMDGSSMGKKLGGSAACCSFLGFVFTLTAYCVWSQNAMVRGLSVFPPTVGVPLLGDRNGTQVLFAVQPNYLLWLGSSWGCALVASIILFFTWITHCFSVGEEEQVPYFNDTYTPPQPAAGGAAQGAASVDATQAAKPVVSI